MRLRSTAIVGMALAIHGAAYAKKEEPAVDPGPPPASVEEFKRISESAILNGFFDPGSAQITWDRGITGGYWKPPLSKKVPGWFTCGLINAKNRMGGYVGARRFVVVQYAGQVVFSSVSDGSNFDFTQIGCDKAINQGVIPVAGASRIVENSVPKDTPVIGVQYSPVADGSYVVGVYPGGPADEAGLVKGMVISHVNGIAIAGFDQPTVGKMILSTKGKVTLTVIGKGDVELTKRILN